MVFSALSEPCRSCLARELVAHSEELRASRQGRSGENEVFYNVLHKERCIKSTESERERDIYVYKI